MSSIADFHCLEFQQLTGDQLYALLQLRAAVFVVEQDCVYQDLDGLDRQAHHMLGMLADGLACYARLLPPGLKYPAAAAIGRVVSAPQARGLGLGRQLMDNCLQACTRLWPGVGITISAQAYLETFYEDFGFVTRRGPYQEDGIPHLEMVRVAP